jgi:hypothetical protein
MGAWKAMRAPAPTWLPFNTQGQEQKANPHALCNLGHAVDKVTVVERGCLATRGLRATLYLQPELSQVQRICEK